jgi:thiamine pyrophosphate-dependent acetolactate synthase large subunit-like protein
VAKTVADQFIEILAAAGVKRVYGIVGDSLNGLTGSHSGSKTSQAFRLSNSSFVVVARGFSAITGREKHRED